MNLLPKWIVANPFPAFYDCESLTAIEQTAMLYEAMNELIEKYNAFAEDANKMLVEFAEGEVEAREDFELKYTKILRRFMCDIEQFISVGMKGAVTEILQSGEIPISAKYNPETEALDLIVGGEFK